MARRSKGEARVAVVTGAGRGIGRATAEAFATEGYRVVIAEIQERPGERTARALRRAGADAVFIQTDVTSAASVQHAVREVLRKLGRIDCLVNNAGILRIGPLASLPVRHLERILAVNLRGPLLMARAVLPAMLRRRAGAIVNVASQLGRSGLGEYVTYCASKFGVMGMTEALADELQATGVSIWAVCPGLVDTPMARLSGATGAERTGLIQPETVARTILDLAAGQRHLPSGSAMDVT